MRIHLNIASKLTLVFVLFSAALMVLVDSLIYAYNRSELEASTLSDLSSLSFEKQSALTDWLADKEEEARALAASAQIQAAAARLAAASAAGDTAQAKLAHDDLVGALQAWAGAGQDFLGWMLLDAGTGQVLAATDASLEGKFREDQPYYTNGLHGIYVQNPYYAIDTQQVMLTISLPVNGRNGPVVAILAGNVNLSGLNAIIGRRTGLRQTEDNFLVNTSGMFVTQPRFLADPAVLQRGVHTEAVTRCLAQADGSLTALDYRGIPALIVYRWLPERQMCLITKIDEAEALAPVDALARTMFLGSLLVFFAATALAIWLARSITRPLQTMTRGVISFAHGNLETRIPETGTDELGQLAREFNRMANTLDQKDAQLLAYASDLEEKVTERTAQIAASEERLGAFFASNVGGYAYCDICGRVKQANDEYLRMTGYSREELNAGALSWMDLTPPEFIPLDEAAIAQARIEGACPPYQKQYLRRDGTRIWVLVGFVLVGPQKEDSIAFVLDLTDLKQKEAEIQTLNQELEKRVALRTLQLEAANHELEAFTYSVSHDLRAPLRSINGFSNIFLEEFGAQLDSEGRRLMDIIRTSAAKMDHLITDLLALSRTTRADLKKASVEMAALAQAVYQEVAAPEVQRAFSFTAADLPPAFGDLTLLHQVWTNLLSNAIKYTLPKDNPRVEVGAYLENEMTVYFVKDNGVGFNPELAHLLFGIFQRLHKAEDFEGNGVGLAIVQRIIQHHGGRVWAEGQLNQGATFYFSLPGS